MKLLSVGKDAKTIKGVKYGVMTGILYLAPANISGYQVCPKASEGCKAACLYTAGHGIYTSVQTARINRTLRFFRERPAFMADIVADIIALVKKAAKDELIPAVRLNGTSDIAWEKFAVVRDGKTYDNVFTAFPKVQFYDYTKILGRKSALKYKNYHLTFSLAESNTAEALKALDAGFNVAVVMKIGKKDTKPTHFSGYPVIDGDLSDIRFNDKRGGHIVALTAKGMARKDVSGFVKELDFQFTS